MTEPLLSVGGLTVRYGPVVALEDVSLEVHPAEIVALVGANGAGKSTLLKTLSGLLRPAAGTMRFGEIDLARSAAHHIVRHGLVHVPEGRHVFPRFGLRDNLVAGAFSGDFRGAAKRADELIDSHPALARRADSLAGQLSGGEQQLLVIHRALMSDPRMIMLDEPSMGLSPLLADQVLDLVAELRTRGKTVLLVEQNAHAALDIADRVYALGSGRVLHAGASSELRNDQRFVDQFLGVVAAEAHRPGRAEANTQDNQP